MMRKDTLFTINQAIDNMFIRCKIISMLSLIYLKDALQIIFSTTLFFSTIHRNSRRVFHKLQRFNFSLKLNVSKTEGFCKIINTDLGN